MNKSLHNHSNDPKMPYLAIVWFIVGLSFIVFAVACLFKTYYSLSVVCVIAHVTTHIQACSYIRMFEGIYVCDECVREFEYDDVSEVVE